MTVKSNSRSVLFLTELILAILIFALCMGICGSVFVRSFEATSNSTDLNHAVIQAQNAAERFHSQSDMASIARSLDGYLSGNEAITVYFNKNWNVSQELSGVAFVMRMDISQKWPLETAVITITGNKDIYQLTSVKNVALRRI